MEESPGNAELQDKRESGSEDREIECIECAQTFVFTGREQKFYKEKGFESDPRRCAGCRNQRKARSQSSGRERSRPQQAAAHQPEYRMGGCISGRVFSQMSQRSNHRRPAGSNRGPGGASSRGNTERHGNGRPQESRNNRNQNNKSCPITCAKCGRQAFVPFTPRNKTVVYCPDCYRSQKRQRR